MFVRLALSAAPIVAVRRPLPWRTLRRAVEIFSEAGHSRLLLLKYTFTFCSLRYIVVPTWTYGKQYACAQSIPYCTYPVAYQVQSILLFSMPIIKSCSCEANRLLASARLWYRRIARGLSSHHNESFLDHAIKCVIELLLNTRVLV